MSLPTQEILIDAECRLSYTGTYALMEHKVAIQDLLEAEPIWMHYTHYCEQSH